MWPLFFAVTTLSVAKAADEGCQGWSHWYLDDGYIAGPRVAVNNILQTVESQARSIGLVLNRSKCSLLIKDTLPDHLFGGIPRITPAECMTVLGCPVGNQQACQTWVSANVLAPYKRALGRLEGLGDPRASSLVLRQCLSSCKLAWILRTAEPAVALWAAAEASPLMRRTWCTILGDEVPDAHWRLSNLPIREGGAGLSDPGDIVHAALVSSWLAAATQPGPLACSDPPQGWTEVLTHLATLAPNMGSPLISAFQINGLQAV